MEDGLQMLLPVLEVKQGIVVACNEAFTEQVGYAQKR